MGLCKNHSGIYFDALIRIKKSEAVLSLIYATYYSKESDESKRKEEIAQRLKQAYILIKGNAGTYDGSTDKFQSQYTIGLELGIWKNSNLKLCDLAIKVAENKITIRDYFDIVFLNYFQPVCGKLVHILYHLLEYMNKHNVNFITKEELASIYKEISGATEDGDTNGAFNMLLGTNYFISNDNNSLTYVGEEKIEILLQKCNLEYVEKGYSKALEELATQEKYSDYLTSDHVLTTSKTNPINSTNFSPSQIIYYGVPGSGKSHTVSKEINKVIQNDKDKEEQVVRVVFHPEYTNADFVGQVMPTLSSTEGKVEYKFIPGPFAKILRKAYLNPAKPYFLIVEEINRGNAAAIFGDLFQLLDRLQEDESDATNGFIYKKGWSSYSVNNDFLNWYIRETVWTNEPAEISNDEKGIATKDNEEMKSILIDNMKFSLNTGIRLPPNLSLLATMNTSDQNVFTLDNAFQRRWDMRLIPNQFLEKDEKGNIIQKVIDQMNAKINIQNQTITWKDFQETINAIIGEKGNESSLSSMEDKRLGCWFVKAENRIIDTDKFKNKVLKYLWDDAFKFCRSEVFVGNIKNFEELQKSFDTNGFNIFGESCNLSSKIKEETSTDTEQTAQSETTTPEA